MNRAFQFLQWQWNAEILASLLDGNKAIVAYSGICSAHEIIQIGKTGDTPCWSRIQASRSVRMLKNLRADRRPNGRQVFACSSTWPRGNSQLDVLGGGGRHFCVQFLLIVMCLMAVPTVMYVRLRKSFGIPSLIL